MIKFMVIAAPRSGTAWCANWLTAGARLCLHDPLWDVHYEDWDALEAGGTLGIACTGIALWPDWVNAHPSRKVILHRAPDEVNASLEKVGLKPCSPGLFLNLQRIVGLHVDWRSLFHDPWMIHGHLFDEPFDTKRHRLLRDMQVTSRHQDRRQNPAVMQRILSEGNPWST